MRPPSDCPKMLRWLTASVLLIAAVLKAWSGSASAFETSIPPAAVVGYEVLLAGWLLTGFAPGASWAFALASFTAFTLVALRTALAGSVSCGCFGRAVVNPWLAVGLDVTIITLLLVSRPVVSHICRDCFLTLRVLARPALIAGALLAVFGFGSVIGFGSWHSVIAHLRGEAVSFDQDTYDAGRLLPGSMATLTVRVNNWSQQAAMIYAGAEGCACQIDTPLPLNVAPNSSVVVWVSLRVPSAVGRLRKKFYLLTDHDRARRIDCVLACTVGTGSQGGEPGDP